VLGFIDAWRRPRDRPSTSGSSRSPAAYYEAHLTLERAARLVRSTPAEVEAALKLATLEEDLDLLGRRMPPMTTWFLLAEATHDGLVAAVKALDEWEQLRPPKDAPVAGRHRGAPPRRGPSTDARVATLDAKVFWAPGGEGTPVRAPQAEGAQVPRGRLEAAPRRTAADTAQTAWAKSLLRELIDGGAVRPTRPTATRSSATPCSR
jgi:hypothetical protein